MPHRTDPPNLANRPMPHRQQVRPTIRFSDWFCVLTFCLVPLPYLLDQYGIETPWKPYRLASGLVVVFAHKAIMRRASRWNSITHPIFFSIGVLALVTWITTGRVILLEAAGLHVFSYCVAFLAPFALSSHRAATIAMSAYCVSLVASSLYDLVFLHNSRLEALMGNPNQYGLAASFSVLFLTNPKIRAFFLPRMIVVALLLCLTLLTGSRTATLTAVLVVLLQFWNNRSVRYAALIALTALTSAAAFDLDITSSGLLGDRLYALNRVSEREHLQAGLSERLELARWGIEYGIESSFLGIGYHSIKNLNKSRHFTGLVAHNAYVTVIVEWGVVATALLLLAMFRLFKLQCALPQTYFSKTWVAGFLLILCATSSSSNTCYDPSMWLALGFTISVVDLEISSLSRAVRPKNRKISI